MILKFNLSAKKKAPKRHWLIDSENTADRWVCDMLFNKETKRDKVTVFYTKNTCNMKYETVKLLRETRKPKIEWIECFTGSNALDFQLVSQLGVYIGAHPKYEYIILSNDTGYDAVIKYWRKQGTRIVRLNTAAIRTQAEKKDRSRSSGKPGKNEKSRDKDKSGKKKEQAKKLRKNRKAQGDSPATPEIQQVQPERSLEEAEQEKKSGSASKEPAAELSPERIPEISTVTELQKQLEEKLKEACGQDEQLPGYVMELAKSVSIKNKSMLNTACCAMFGQIEGGSIYRCIKENEEFHDLLRAQHLSSRKDRANSYITLMLELSGYETEDIEKLTEIGYKAPKNNLSNLNRFLVKVLGQEEGVNFYHIIKPHLAVLRKL